jgi:hypothetical protein
VRSSLPTAQLLVDGDLCGIGKCEVELKPGTHDAEARKPGFSGESRQFAAKPGLELELTPQPLPSAVEVVSDLMSGELQLDSKPPVPLGGGGAQIAGIEPGEHRLRFTSGAFRAEFKFESQPGIPPRLLVPPAATGLRAVVVAGAGSEARLWSTEKNAELAIGARELGLIPEEGIALPAMERGVHRFVLKPAKGQQASFMYEIAENPTAWISLRTNRSYGTLRIVASSADDARILLDGKDSGARIRRGRAVLLTTPGAHEVAVEKAGFSAASPERVSVRDGGEVELTFKLEPVATRAALPVTGAPPGVLLFVDGKAAGPAGLDGSALLGDLDPGAHVVTAIQDGYAGGRWEVRLKAGRNPALHAAMQRALATLRIVVTPPGAEPRLTVRRLGQFEERPITDRTLQLPEGEYTAIALESSGERVAKRVRLEAGKETVVTLALASISPGPAPAAAPVPPPVVKEASKQLSLNDWDGAPGWNRQGDLIVNEGGGIMLAPTRSSAQSLTFTAHVRRGKAVRWVTQFRDVDNYTLYELRGDSLNRVDVVGGKWITRKHAGFKGGPVDPVRIRMNQQAGTLHTSAFVGGKWLDLDAVEAPNGTGRFGFYVPGRDRLALSEFRYDYR